MRKLVSRIQNLAFTPLLMDELGCAQDGDGKLTADELRAHLSRRGQEGEAEKIFAVLDADADGSITVAELKKAYNSSAELRHALGPIKDSKQGHEA